MIIGEIRVLLSEHLDAFHVFDTGYKRLCTIGVRNGAWRKISGRGLQTFASKGSYDSLRAAIKENIRDRWPNVQSLSEASEDGRWLIHDQPEPQESPVAASGPATDISESKRVVVRRTPGRRAAASHSRAVPLPAVPSRKRLVLHG